MKFKLMNHTELTERQLYQIATIKSQHWCYSIDSQIEWIKKKYKEGDVHITLLENGVIVGYVAIVQISIVADGNILDIHGISCLCVEKSYLNKGYGSLLVERALKFAKANKKNICLLCKEKLVKFYERCGYVVLNPQSIFVEQAHYNHKLMLYDCITDSEVNTLKVARKILIDRNF